MLNKTHKTTIIASLILLLGLVLLSTVQTEQSIPAECYLEITEPHLIVIKRDHKGVEMEEEVIFVDSMKEFLDAEWE